MINLFWQKKWKSYHKKGIYFSFISLNIFCSVVFENSGVNYIKKNSSWWTKKLKEAVRKNISIEKKVCCYQLLKDIFLTYFDK